MRQIFGLLFGLTLLSGAASANAIVTLTLNPIDGFLSGAPGSAVGWGYDVSTDSDYILIDYLGFDDLTPVGTQNLLPPPSTGASAGSDVIVPWIAGVSGFEYDIDPGAIAGSSSTGGVFLVYDEYTDSTLNTQVASGATVYATNNGVQVNAEVEVTPEPGSLLLFGCGIAAAALIKLRRRVA
jgi:hypothetical protein